MDRSYVKKLFRVLFSYPGRLFSRVSFRATVVDCRIDRTAVIEHHTNVRYSSVGRYSYISSGSGAAYAKIGSFCSIASGVSVGGGSHPLEYVSTSPVFHAGRNILRRNFGTAAYAPYKETVIGNDVWIGNRAIVLQGVTVGDGAVIGAGSVVTHDVPPYEIWAGNPARCIRKRFDDDTVKKLLDIRWWDWDEDRLRAYGDRFEDCEKFIADVTQPAE